MDRKPRASFIPITLKLFWDLYPELERRTKENLRDVMEKLKRYIDLFSEGLIGNEIEAENAGRKIAQMDLDLLVIWESGYVTSNLPIRVICYSKDLPIALLITQRDPCVPDDMDYVRYMENTALTGMVELGNALIKNGIRFTVIMGQNDEDETFLELARYAKAAMVKSELKNLNIGVCGHVFPGMLDITIDEETVNKIGPKVTRISLYEIARRLETVPPQRVKEFLQETAGIYDVTLVDSNEFFKAAKLYCVLEDLNKDMGVNAFCLLCQDCVNIVADAPPCFALSMVQNRLGLVCGCEGDIGNTIGAFILKSLTGKSPMFVDWTMYDENKNAIFLQHCGMADPNILCSPTLKSHSEKFGFSGSGVAFEAMGKPGPVTMVSLMCEGNKWKIFASEGEAIPASPRPCRLNQIMVRVKLPVKEYLKKICEMGVTHHLNVGYGHTTKEIRYLANLLDIEFLSI